MPEKPCCDLKTERFGLVRRSLGEGGWLFPTPCHCIAVRRRRIKTTIFISSTIFFQSNFAGLLKLPLENCNSDLTNRLLCDNLTESSGGE